MLLSLKKTTPALGMSLFYVAETLQTYIRQKKTPTRGFELTAFIAVESDVAIAQATTLLWRLPHAHCNRDVLQRSVDILKRIYQSCIAQ